MFTTALILAIPTACIAWTIAETEFFRDFREALARWSKARNDGDCRGWRKWFRCKLSYLPTCYYCAAHWIGLLLFLGYPFKLLSTGPYGWLVAYATQVSLAVVYATVFHLIRVQIRKTKAEADLAERRRAARRDGVNPGDRAFPRWHGDSPASLRLRDARGGSQSTRPAFARRHSR